MPVLRYLLILVEATGSWATMACTITIPISIWWKRTAFPITSSLLKHATHSGTAHLLMPLPDISINLGQRNGMWFGFHQIQKSPLVISNEWLRMVMAKRDRSAATPRIRP